ncbi:MAG: hypothetical protein GYB64_15560, partial [Chloroflexi bacterium]|nr:hypothetical protein [Chloroflexota bacterium]
MKLTLYFGLLVILLGACTSQAARIPTATPMPTEEPAADPAIDVNDQAVEEGTVTVAQVTVAEAGWLVIHADADGEPGPVIGQTRVEAGESTDVSVEVDTEAVTDTLYAMLHQGEEGVFEFPDSDQPVTGVDDNIIVEAFAIEDMTHDIKPSVQVYQQLIEDGVVTVARVVATEPNWLVVRADADGEPGPVIGQTRVESGESTGVSIEVDAEAATDTLYVVLHEDSGEIGTFEYPDDDQPIIGPEEQAVVDSFTLGEPVTPAIEVDAQTIENGTVTIEQVVVPERGWISIHPAEVGTIGPVIGQALLEAGENTDVVVEIDV